MSSISYSFTPSTDPLIPLTIGQMFERSVNRHPDQVCVISHHQKLSKTYKELDLDSNRLANYLKSLNVSKGDRIGIWSGNCYEWAIVQIATAKIGAILVTINPAYKEDELVHCLNLVGVKISISCHSYKSNNYFEMVHKCSPKVPTLQKAIFINVPDCDDNLVTNNDEPFDILDKSSDQQVDGVDDLSFDDPINIQFTSGTTGSPKGATLTHFNVVNNSYFAGKRMFQGLKNKIICLPNPLYHSFGCVTGMVQSIIHDGTIILPSFFANPVSTLDSITKYKPDTLFGTPTMFNDMYQHFIDGNSYDTSSVERVIVGGSTISSETLDMINKMFPNSTTCIGYGSTETSPATTATDPFRAGSGLNCGGQDINCIGKALEHVEVKIADPTTGLTLKHGQKGELMTRGHHTFLGYYNQKDKTDQVLDCLGWYHSG